MRQVVLQWKEADGSMDWVQMGGVQMGGVVDSSPAFDSLNYRITSFVVLAIIPIALF